MLTLEFVARSPKEGMISASTGMDAAVTLVEDALVGGDVSKNTDKAIRKSLEDPQVGGHPLDDPAKPLATIIGLTLGAPEFQVK
jgi:hypothetical protein